MLVIQTKKVPLSYAPKAKFLERIREHADLDLDQKVALKATAYVFRDPGVHVRAREAATKDQ